jgi:penicillin-binding protein-related factor A (putative recombinase)
MGVLEKQIENHVLTWLKFKSILGVKIKTIGTYDQRLGKFRKPSPLYRKGVSDILGLHEGRFFALEIKSAKGKLSPEQVLFLDDVRSRGGVALVIRSVEQLEKYFKQLGWVA